MKDDRLLDAARALRDESPLSPARPDETRARILSTLRKQRARRLLFVKAAIPLAAVLAGSIAWAAATGRLPASFRAVFPAAPAGPSSPSDPPHRPALTPGALPSSKVALPDPAIPSPLAASSTPESQGPPTQATKLPSRESQPAKMFTSLPIEPVVIEPPATSAPEPAAAPSTSATEPPPAAPDELALYSAAHRLHFVDRNPSAALSAWDTYLRAAPRGRFAVEAQYNRALCLLRLGRTAEAKKVLSGFANGAYGGYRQAEAGNLLEAMDGASPKETP